MNQHTRTGSTTDLTLREQLQAQVSHLKAQDAATRDIAQQTLRAVKSNVNEARYGVVNGDMQIVVDALNRLDLLADDTAKRLGLF